MKLPILYNVPQGKSEEDALPDELLQLLGDVFKGVTHAFGEDAMLYRLDIGRVYESVQSGELVIAGQFVDRSDGELFEFEINQATNKVGYQSTGVFLDKKALSLFLGEDAGDGETGDTSGSSRSRLNPFELLLEAINEEGSEAYQSPFAVKLRKDLNYLGALSAAMYHAAVTIEAQALYTGLHTYAIQYALRGLRIFSQAIASIEGEAAGETAAAWVEEHGLDCAAAVVKEFSSRRCVCFQETISPGDQEANQELSELVEEAIGMAIAATTELIKSVVEADDYQPGDVQATLAASIEEYCPIDNSEGYSSVANALQLAADWQEVINRSGCQEDLSMQALGLPSGDTIAAESSALQDQQGEELSQSGSGNEELPDGERIFYVNVGEGPSRNWDDCRQFGFLAAGNGRKWSKQLEKLKTGDTVIAYLKGYGYVGIGTVTSTAIPATKFMVNGVPIKELPLINDTIRSIKRFSKENGEYLIGVEWQVAVPRGQAAWKANAGLYTTPLVCASLQNQPTTVHFVIQSLGKQSLAEQVKSGKEEQSPTAYSMNLRELPYPQTCDQTISWLKDIHTNPDNEEDLMFSGVIPESVLTNHWASDDEFMNFFRAVSIDLVKSALKAPGSAQIEIFGIESNHDLGLDSAYFHLWEKAYSLGHPLLQEIIDISNWGDEIVHREVKELPLVAFIPLAHAYQFDSFWEQLSNGWASGDRLTATLEEFLEQMVVMMAPGFYDREIPREILKIGSPRILAEIFEYRDQYAELWTPENIRDVLSSGYADERVKQFIARVLEDEESDPDWESQREEAWTDEEVAELLEMCR